MYGLSVGTYYVDVTDANGCSTQDSVVIIEADFYINAILFQNVLCNGANDGAVSFSAINGTPPYSYDIDGDSIYNDSLSFDWQLHSNHDFIYSK